MLQLAAVTSCETLPPSAQRLGVRVRVKTEEPRTTSRALAVQARMLALYGQIGEDAKHGSTFAFAAVLAAHRRRKQILHRFHAQAASRHRPFPKQFWVAQRIDVFLRPFQIASTIISLTGATSGRPKNARASEGVQSIFTLIFIVDLPGELLFRTGHQRGNRPVGKALSGRRSCRVYSLLLVEFERVEPI